jgi:hypothetical protein
MDTPPATSKYKNHRFPIEIMALSQILGIVNLFARTQYQDKGEREREPFGRASFERRVFRSQPF